MKNRKYSFVAALILALVLGLTACMNDGLRSDTAAPTATADYAPAPTAGAGLNTGTGTGATGTDGNNGNTSSSAGGALGAFDWANGAARVEQAIARVSEIAESRVVVTNSTALVGVKFDNAYKGQLTERIRQMVAAEVMKVDPSIQTVAVTAEPGDVEKIYGLSDQVRAGRTADELADDINAIVRNAATMR